MEPFAKFGTGIYSGNGHKRHKKHKKNGTMRNDQGLRALRDIKKLVLCLLWLDSIFRQVAPDIEKGRTSSVPAI